MCSNMLPLQIEHISSLNSKSNGIFDNFEPILLIIKFIYDLNQFYLILCVFNVQRCKQKIQYLHIFLVGYRVGYINLSNRTPFLFSTHISQEYPASCKARCFVNTISGFSPNDHLDFTSIHLCCDIMYIST
jgi:hypothetical protein